MITPIMNDTSCTVNLATSQSLTGQVIERLSSDAIRGGSQGTREGLSIVH